MARSALFASTIFVTSSLLLYGTLPVFSSPQPDTPLKHLVKHEGGECLT